MGGGGRGVSTFWDPPSRNLLRHFLEILIIYLESSAQELSIGTLFEVSGGTADAQWWVVKGSSAVDLTGMSMLRSAEGNGRQAIKRAKHSQQSMFGIFSKAPAHPAAQNACAANPAAAAPEAVDVEDGSATMCHC